MADVDRAPSDHPATTPLVRVIVADDHALFRRGLVVVLEEDDRLEIMAEAEDGQACVELAEAHTPDVVLVDLRMPEVDGAEVTRRIRALLPTCRVLMLTTRRDDELLIDAIAAGAGGYLLKERALDEVQDAVADLVAGGTRLDAELYGQVLDLCASGAGGGPVELTPGETDVVGRLAAGRTVAEVAEALGVGERTVRSQVRNTLEKLRLHRQGTSVPPPAG